MRSRSGRRRAVTFLLPLLASLLLGAPGCQLNRSFFQMDSNSRVPFFGVDLAPKWPKRSSSVEGVSRLQSETARTGTAEDASASEPSQPQRLTLPVADKSDDAQIDTPPVELFR